VSVSATQLCAAGARPQIWHQASSCCESRLQTSDPPVVSFRNGASIARNYLASGISSGRKTETGRAIGPSFWTEDSHRFDELSKFSGRSPPALFSCVMTRGTLTENMKPLGVWCGPVVDRTNRRAAVEGRVHFDRMKVLCVECEIVGGTAFPSDRNEPSQPFAVKAEVPRQRPGSEYGRSTVRTVRDSSVSSSSSFWKRVGLRMGSTFGRCGFMVRRGYHPRRLEHHSEVQSWVWAAEALYLGRSARIKAKMAAVKQFRVGVEGGGEVSALLTRPTNARRLLVLAHGAGAGMIHPFMRCWRTNWLAWPWRRCDTSFRT